MNAETVLLDAGGVVLDETGHEAAMAAAVVDGLRPIVPGYDLDAYHRDTAEAVLCFVPRVYSYVVFKHLRADPERARRVFAGCVEAQRAARPPLKLMAGIEVELRRLASAEGGQLLSGKQRGRARGSDRAGLLR